jgi:hypothetical protein
MAPDDLTGFGAQVASDDADARRQQILLAVERNAHIWRERAQNEQRLWDNLEAGLKQCGTAADAQRVYADFLWQRMRQSTEDVLRVCEDHRDFVAAFPAEPRPAGQGR